MMPGDWMCPRCNDHVFARNSQCRRCGSGKDGTGELAAGSSLPMGGMGAGGMGGMGGMGMRAQQQLPGDWHCPQCNDLQFARNKQCRMCGAERPLTAGTDSRAV